MVAIIHQLLWSPSSIGCYGRHHPSVVMVAIIHRLLWSPSSISCYGRHHPSVVMVAIIHRLFNTERQGLILLHTYFKYELRISLLTY
jgi:hypothetical protein